MHCSFSTFIENNSLTSAFQVLDSSRMTYFPIDLTQLFDHFLLNSQPHMVSWSLNEKTSINTEMLSQNKMNELCADVLELYTLS